ncbi:SAM-dependent methyltransferase [Roseixanthobacter glucoisosaccharinicivorans]|uniref:SAM-dependent methyltransferase n=1 Tax=Roseixanthobacter glucoisosaccharinicivorans TaxID=3119923 RepID=UPI00372C3DEC
MTGFSTQWLALREPADMAARHAGLTADLALRLARHAGGAESEQRIVDLGAGTGSNLRATAPLLGPRQSWRLLDHDPTLLEAARAALAAWGAEQGMAAHAAGARLVLKGPERRIAIAFAQADLAADPAVGLDSIGAAAPHLVTASAFFDLVSADWIARFAAQVAQRGALFYTVLTCDGRDAWHPGHAADGEIARAFQAHQARDKGFGPAAGPQASALLAEAFQAQGYGTREESSPWRLGPREGQLVAALAEGTAGAVAQTGLLAEETVSAWLNARRHASCEIGHADLLAWPHPAPPLSPG